MNQAIGAVVLAAGKGSRMKSVSQNKVVLTLNQKPMVSYTIDTLKNCHIKSIIVVVGFAKESVIEALGTDLLYAIQEKPQGTGHALKVAMPLISSDISHILVMYGDDSAFYPKDLIQHLVDKHLEHNNNLTMITISKSDPTGLGRIVRNSQGDLTSIVEEKNATPIEKQITEINTGLYCFETNFLQVALDKLQKNPISGEYYLTDVIEYAVKNQYKVEALLWPNDNIWHGVNTPEQLKQAEMRMKQKNAVQ